MPDDNPSPFPGVPKAARRPTDDSIHVALVHTITVQDLSGNPSYQVFLYYLALNARFPKWQSAQIKLSSIFTGRTFREHGFGFS
jgi:hypothetical protein